MEAAAAAVKATAAMPTAALGAEITEGKIRGRVVLDVTAA